MCNYCVIHMEMMRGVLNKGREESVMSVDKPHPPWGKHVDVITGLGSDFAGRQKLRLGATGDIISEAITVKGSLRIDL